ncbi:outer membrane putative beta-barrel porin/alpha-amylase [Luteibacter rhizovicinus]|uniref:Outer membrane putative beta-barrel porin/alpha-amylase n=1 Tax=Luteibacter rhizovicinus TaxID=242606 RepID=A0A4R3YWZ5_9GAMM|nr:transporter [Luteibacter rhizovicinus]TCV95974.1 outer membrane putative beta-barrel porin/alpha-amylase [Luteibacter rhizovicinus]
MTSTYGRLKYFNFAAVLFTALIASAHVPRLHAEAAPSSPICTDRPTKANSTCTVPAGSWQLETDIGSYVRDSQPTVLTETVYYTNPTLKYGLTDSTDLQVNWAPRIRIQSQDRTTGESKVSRGGGDIYLRLKTRILESDRASIALIPFVKAPTAARGIGNDTWEGGIAMPIALPLSGGFSLTLGPELDVLADSDGSGHHGALINLINVSHPVTSRLTLAVEVWDSVNRDPSGTVRQQSADIAMTYLVGPDFQLDAGANFGLNSATPDSHIYIGLSRRF